MAIVSFFFLLVAQLATAHFALEYPTWQADTLTTTKNYSQWIYPCAGVPADLAGSNVTPWPLTGGSLKLDLHHPSSYIFVNLGLGNNVSNFNYTLTKPFWNETGNGTLCVRQLSLPADLKVTDGTNASIQVVTVGEGGDALYNCANIVFRSNATVNSSIDCENSPGVSYSPINGQGNGSTTNSSSSTGQKSAASETRLDSVVILAALGTFAFAMGLRL